MASSSSCSIDDTTESDSDIQFQTPQKKKRKEYRRSIHHGLSVRRANHYDVTPEKQTFSVRSDQHRPSQAYFSSAMPDNNAIDNKDVSDIELEDPDTSSISGSSESSIDSDSPDSMTLSESDEETRPKRNSDRPLFEGSHHTLLSAFTMVMLFVLKHSLSRDAFSDLLHLISSLLPETAGFTTSVYKIKETLKSSLNFQEPILHMYCESCEKYCQDGNQCVNAVCQRNAYGTKMLQFHDLQFLKQLKNLFEGLYNVKFKNYRF